MADRRRVNGPLGGTAPPAFALLSDAPSAPPTRTRKPTAIRKIFLRNGLVPSASGSAYLELENVPRPASKLNLITSQSTLKLTCAVHGPKPLPRSAPYSSNVVLNTHVKFAPFATRARRGYIRDSSERDLAVHLETALRGIVLADRWPKSGVDVIVTVLEGDEDERIMQVSNSGALSMDMASIGLMSILSGCITVACSALIDAGIDCVDMVTGGMAALTPELAVIYDPVPSEHSHLIACCIVGYLKSRDELTEVWINSNGANVKNVQAMSTQLLEGAVQAAAAAQRVIIESIKESMPG